MRLIDADKLKREHPVVTNIVDEAPTVDVLTWKDFMDFLDDNNEDFDSIGKRFDALEERLQDIEEKLLDTFEQITLTKMMERWEHLARTVELLKKKFDILCDIEDHEHQNIWDRLDTIEETREITKGDINWLIKQLKEGRRLLDNEID